MFSVNCVKKFVVLLTVMMARNMDEKQPLLKNENQTQIDIENLGKNLFTNVNTEVVEPMWT